MVAAAAVVAAVEHTRPIVLVLTPPPEEAQRRAAAEALDHANPSVLLWPCERRQETGEIRTRLLQEYWAALGRQPRFVLAEAWAENAFAMLSRRRAERHTAILRVQKLALEDSHLVVETAAQQGKLRARQTLPDLRSAGV